MLLVQASHRIYNARVARVSQWKMDVDHRLGILRQSDAIDIRVRRLICYPVGVIAGNRVVAKSFGGLHCGGE